MKSLYCMIGVVIGCAASAQGQMSFENSSAQFYHGLGVYQGASQYFEFDQPFADTAELAGLTTPTPFSYSRSVNPANYSGLTRADATLSGVIQQSSSRFQTTWNYRADVASVFGASPTLETTSDFNVYITSAITFTSNATVRMYFASSSNAYNDGDQSATTNLFVGGDPLSPVSPFSYQSSLGGPIPNPFDITFPVIAGQVLDFELSLSLLRTNVDGAGVPQPNLATVWDRNSAGSLIIEVIPSPSSAALLGIGALVATRRRR